MPVSRNAPAASQPPIRAVPLGLFPTAGSLQEAVELAFSRMPVLNQNEMLSILMTYHNTLLAQIEKEKSRN